MHYKGRPSTVENSQVLQFHLLELPYSNTTYEYELRHHGSNVLYRGSFHTPVETGTPYNFKFAFSSCMDEYTDPIVFQHMAAQKQGLLFLAHLGDLHYDDINVEEGSLQLYRNGYHRALTTKAGKSMLNDVQLPMVYMYDDHDFGPNNSDKMAKGRTSAIQTYREYVPHYPLDTSLGNELNVQQRSGASAHQSFAIGQVYFILTDLRSQRTPNHAPVTPDKTVLGPHQKRWFISTIQNIIQAKNTYKVLVWCNTMPWLDDERKWGHFPHEQDELASILAEARKHLEKVIIVSGDAHMIAIDDGTHSKGGVPVLHAAAFGRDGSTKGGPYSHGMYPGFGQYGVVEITTNHCIIFQGWNAIQNKLVQTWNSCTGESLYSNALYKPPPKIVRKAKRKWKKIKQWFHHQYHHLMNHKKEQPPTTQKIEL